MSEEVPFRLRFIVVWVIILTILKIFISLNAIFTYGIYHAYADPSQVPEVIQFLYYFALRTVYWITDLLVVTSLIYFYYEQAKSLNIPRKQTASEQLLFNLSSAVALEGSKLNSINADDKFLQGDS